VYNSALETFAPIALNESTYTIPSVIVNVNLFTVQRWHADCRTKRYEWRASWTATVVATECLGLSSCLQMQQRLNI